MSHQLLFRISFKIQIRRNIDLFLTLNEYTDNERDDYIKKYIEALSEQQIVNHQSTNSQSLNRVIKKYQDIIKKCPKNIRSCLGIPLESYLFCAGFESEIVHDFRNDSTVLDSPTTTVLSGVILMEKFLKYKLELFWRNI